MDPPLGGSAEVAVLDAVSPQSSADCALEPTPELPWGHRCSAVGTAHVWKQFSTYRTNLLCLASSIVSTHPGTSSSLDFLMKAARALTNSYWFTQCGLRAASWGKG